MPTGRPENGILQRHLPKCGPPEPSTATYPHNTITDYLLQTIKKPLVTETDDYYIDLVFYNYILKCFVLIDLKTKKITHQDVGQMDMYVRMYDDLKRTEGDNPTLGIVLCAETDQDIAKYSVLNGNKQLFASKYLTVLPSEDELRKEIESQKTIFYLQQEELSKC